MAKAREIVAVAGAFLFVTQCAWWLYFGEWVPLPLGIVLLPVGSLQEWLADPRSWIGLHKIVDLILSLPLPMCLMVAAASDSLWGRRPH
jgi:hypothetical protein